MPTHKNCLPPHQNSVPLHQQILPTGLATTQPFFLDLETTTSASSRSVRVRRPVRWMRRCSLSGPTPNRCLTARKAWPSTRPDAILRCSTGVGECSSSTHPTTQSCTGRVTNSKISSRKFAFPRKTHDLLFFFFCPMVIDFL